MKDWSVSAKGLRGAVTDAVNKCADMPEEFKAAFRAAILALPATCSACSLDAHSRGGVLHSCLKIVF